MRYWLPVLAYVGLIFAVSSIANLAPPKAFKLTDKMYHVAEYALLGVLVTRAYWGSRLSPSFVVCLLLATLTGLATGLADELLQAHVPGRVSSALDFRADALGLALGQVFYAVVRRRGQ